MDDGPPVDELVLDCRGMRCPLPVIELAKRIGDVPVGGAVRVIADDPAAAIDIPAWCRMRSHEYAGAPDADRSADDADGYAPPAPSYVVRRLH